MNLDISQIMSDLKITGATFAVIRDGEIVECGAQGYADSAKQIPTSATTIFEAASLGKPVFAYAVLKLVDKGFLSLDDPLNLKYLTTEVRTDLACITPRHILSHTSGLPNWRSAERPLKAYFSPGHRFSYSGEGYVWLQNSIEALMKDTLDGIVSKYVFEPLGMHQSSFDARNQGGGNVAVPHDTEGNSLPKVNSAPNAAGSLHTNSQDYARFLMAVLTGEGLAKATATNWLQPVCPVPRLFFSALDPVGGPELDKAVSWGLGWGLEGEGGRFFHWGSNPGFKSFTLGSVAEQSAIIVLSSGPAELAFGPQLVRAAIPGPHPCLDWFARG